MIPTGSSVVPIGGAYMYMTSYWYDYTGYAKKVSLLIFAIT